MRFGKTVHTIFIASNRPAREDVFLKSNANLLASRQFSQNKEQNDRADDRDDQTGGVKRRTRFRLGKQAADHSTGDRATDAE